MRLRTLILGFLLPLAGCEAPKPSLAGRVTLDGKPLEAGFVTLHPDGIGNTVGAEVRGGGFLLENVPSGPGKIVVTTPPLGAQQVKKGAAVTLKFDPAAQPVTATTEGNSVPVIVQTGTQSLEIALRTPTKKRQP